MNTTMPGSTIDPSMMNADRGNSIIIADSILLVLCVLVTIMRVGAILWSDLKFKVDDYSFVFALACNVLADVADMKATSAGLGRHMQLLTPSEEHSFRLWGELALIFAVFADWSVKIAICLFILRIIKGTNHNRIRWATWVLLIFTSLCNFIACVLWGLQANPLRKMWDTWIAGTIAPTSQLVASVYMITASNAVIDLFYALSPIAFISGLQMGRKKKYLILSLTGCGLLVFAAAMVKVAYGSDFASKDISWGWVNIFIASSIERHTALIVASLPALIPWWNHGFPKIKSFSSRYFQSSNKSLSFEISDRGSVSQEKWWNRGGQKTKQTGRSSITELEYGTRRSVDSAISTRDDGNEEEVIDVASESDARQHSEFCTSNRPMNNSIIMVQNEFSVERESSRQKNEVEREQRRTSEPWR